MDILFVLIAVCPAVIMAKHDLRKEAVSWKTFLPRFGEWFYGMTLINLLILYFQDWGDFDFSILSVQFLVNYMLNSIAVILLIQCCRFLQGAIKRKDKEEEL